MGLETRNRRIDLIRGVAILLVLFHHFVIAYRLDDTSLARALGWNAIRAVARNGNYGVTMFFVVSGFLITANARRRWGGLDRVEAKGFYVRRAARILPCLLLLLLVVDGLALAGWRVFQNGPASGPVPYWLSHLAALTSWMNVLVGRDGWFNYPLGVLWSLSVEEAFYLSFPLACLLLRTERRLLAFWSVFIVLGPIWRLTHAGEEGEWLYGYLACFDGIAIGCCAALLIPRLADRDPWYQQVSFCAPPPANPARIPALDDDGSSSSSFSMRGRVMPGRGLSAALRLATLAGMAGLYLSAPIAQTNVLGVSLMAAGTALLLLDPSSGQGEARFGPASAALPWLGRHSYELYLFHLVVLGALRTVWPARAVAGDGKLLLLAGYLAASAILAALIAALFAEPLNRALRRMAA